MTLNDSSQPEVNAILETDGNVPVTRPLETEYPADAFPVSLHSGVKWRHRIAVRLMVTFFICCVLVFGSALSYNYYRAREIIAAKTEIHAWNLLQATSGKVETILASVSAYTDGMARSLETFPSTQDQLLDFIKTSVLAHPDVYGSTVAFEPSANPFFEGPYAPYFYRSADGTGFIDLTESYEYQYQDWFQIPRELERPEWSEPYYDEGGGNILMATYSVPFYVTRNGQRRFAGIVTADISLEHLVETISSIKVLKTGYGFLLSRAGTFLAHPRQNMIMNESLFSLAEERNSRTLRDIGRRMIAGGTGFIPYRTISGIQSRMAYGPLPTVGWSLGVVFPEDELFADIRELTIIMAVIGLAGIALLTLAVYFIARSITTPIRSLTAAADEIAAGDFEADLPEPGLRDEVGALTNDFRVMRDSLKTHIARLAETTAIRERMESELQIAHDIQMSILPKIFPPFPNRAEFDLYALIAPAREVGGDFYDFFQVGEDQLCFVIGDVSGKGVPASLFMAVTKTLIKSFAREGVMPDAIISHANQELAVDNETCMFVTLFCGLLNMKTGEVRYANAGHNPPLIVRQDGRVEWLPRTNALVAGVMPDFLYQWERLTLAPGDSLYLYTDGVTEAMNNDNELFSEERLEKELASLTGLEIKAAIQKLVDAINAFTGGAPQSDDITMMMIRYWG